METVCPPENWVTGLWKQLCIDHIIDSAVVNSIIVVVIAFSYLYEIPRVLSQAQVLLYH